MSNYELANAGCINAGGKLAIVNTTEIQNFLNNIVTAGSGRWCRYSETFSAQRNL